MFNTHFQRLDNSVLQVNRYQADEYWRNVLRYPPDRELPRGLRHPLFKQPDLVSKIYIRFQGLFLLVTPVLRIYWLFNPQECLASNFSLQYQPCIKHLGHENKGNDHQLKQPLIVEQILLVRTLRSVENSMENMHIDFRVYRVKIVSDLRPSLSKSIPVFKPVLCKKPRIQNQFYTIKARNFSCHVLWIFSWNCLTVSEVTS